MASASGRKKKTKIGEENTMPFVLEHHQPHPHLLNLSPSFPCSAWERMAAMLRIASGRLGVDADARQSLTVARSHAEHGNEGVCGRGARVTSPQTPRRRCRC